MQSARDYRAIPQVFEWLSGIWTLYQVVKEIYRIFPKARNQFGDLASTVFLGLVFSRMLARDVGNTKHGTVAIKRQLHFLRTLVVYRAKYSGSAWIVAWLMFSSYEANPSVVGPIFRKHLLSD